jgi:uncharacterized protein YggU (UPF0235/DUF167 family)
LTSAAERHPKAWATVAGGLKLRVRVTPKSSGQDRVEGLMPGADGPLLRVRVRALAQEGAANAALTRLVAAWLGVPPSAVALIGGPKARTKTLMVTGDGPELATRAAARLAATSARTGG